MARETWSGFISIRLRSSLNANPAIVTRSFSPSCVTSKPMCQLNWTSISSSTTMPPTSTPRSGLARPPSALAHSLHAYLRLLAQPGLTLLRAHNPTHHPSWLVRFHRRPRQKNRPLHPQPQCKFTSLRVDRDRRLHPPETRATLSANFRDRTLASSVVLSLSCQRARQLDLDGLPYAS